MARGRRHVLCAPAEDEAARLVDAAATDIDHVMDGTIAGYVARDLGLGQEGENLIAEIRRLPLAPGEDGAVWYDACSRAALMKDPELFAACRARYQMICREQHAVAERLLPADDSAQFDPGRDALWDSAGEGSALWLTIATQWGGEGLTVGEVRAELQARMEEAEAMTPQMVRPDGDLDVVRARLTGIDWGEQLHERLLATCRGLIRAGEIDTVLGVTAHYWRLRGDAQRAAAVDGLDDEQRAIAHRLLRARREADMSVEGADVFALLPDVSAREIDRELAPRTAGPGGDVAIGMITVPRGNPDTSLRAWQHMAARALEAPDLLTNQTGGALLVPLAAEQFDAWRARYEASDAFAGYRVGRVAGGIDEGDIHLLALLRAEGPVEAIGARVYLSTSFTGADTPEELRAEVHTSLRAQGIDPPAHVDPVPCAIDPAGVWIPDVPTAGRAVADPIAAPVCLHPRAAWQRNAPGDALVLNCPDCTRRALAVVPLHMAPGEQIRDVDRYVARERYYAVLRGDELPETLGDLQRRDGTVSLDPAEHLPHLAGAQGPAEDLSTALFG